MVKKYKNITEIITKRGRLLRRTKRWKHVEKRIHGLINSYWFIRETHLSNEIKKELYRYIPIGAVACSEGWFRLAVADLIDYGLPYRENLKKIKDISFDVESILAIHEKSVSIGEIIAQFFTVNKPEDIIGIMSEIIGDDFASHMKNVRINPDTAPRPVTIGSDWNMFFTDFSKTFELRHIFCHELATSIRFNRQQIEDCIYSSFMFLVAADRAVQVLLDEEYGGSIGKKRS